MSTSITGGYSENCFLDSAQPIPVPPAHQSSLKTFCFLAIGGLLKPWILSPQRHGTTTAGTMVRFMVTSFFHSRFAEQLSFFGRRQEKMLRLHLPPFCS